ncbi:unnamed protein product [Rhizoctonia solani]|uniref:MI domain-containing protein n=1 Tax=Rhizoctonia solani TaxID=456999 RepID=A0A8H3BLH3_9AGAM|nr:unnamed protein product [Rhizoctonia solani]
MNAEPETTSLMSRSESQMGITADTNDRLMGSISVTAATPKSAVNMPSTTPTHSKKKKVNVHSLFGGGGVPPASRLVSIPSIAVSHCSVGDERHEPSNGGSMPPSNHSHPSLLSISSSANVRPKRLVPGALNLTHTWDNRKAAPPPGLAGARFIEDLKAIPYPNTVKPPNPDLNFMVAPGRFRYDREFLLRFMGVCRERPDSLPALDIIGLEPGAGPNAERANRRRVGWLGIGNAPPRNQAPIEHGVRPGLTNRSRFAMGVFRSPSSFRPQFVGSNATKGGITFGRITNDRLAYPSHTLDQGGTYPGEPTYGTRSPTRANDLFQFGKIQKPTHIQFGPSNVFNKKGSKRDSNTGRGGGVDIFSALSMGNAAGALLPAEHATNSRKLIVNVGPSRPPAVVGEGKKKKKLTLLARTKLKEMEANISEGEEDLKKKKAAPTAMTEKEIENKVKEDVKEYLGAQDIKEAIMTLETLPSEHRHLFVDKLVNASMDGGDKVVVLTEKVFSAARSRSVISPECFERGMLPTIEMADDLSIDVPKAYEWLARVMYAAGMDKVKTEEMADRISVYGKSGVPPRERLIKAFDQVRQ